MTRNGEIVDEVRRVRNEHAEKFDYGECREEMEISQALIEKEGKGVIIWLDQEGKGNGHLALMKSVKFKAEGFSQSEAYKKAGYEADVRSFRPAAEILSDLKLSPWFCLRTIRIRQRICEELP